MSTPLKRLKSSTSRVPLRSPPASSPIWSRVRGLGICRDAGADEITREFNAIPVLAYYDIFKNYYANKMENGAYVIGANVDNDRTIQKAWKFVWEKEDYSITGADTTKHWVIPGKVTNNGESTLVQLVGENLVKENIYIEGDNINSLSYVKNVKYSTVFNGPDIGKKCVEFDYTGSVRPL